MNPIACKPYSPQRIHCLTRNPYICPHPPMNRLFPPISTGARFAAMHDSGPGILGFNMQVPTPPPPGPLQEKKAAQEVPPKKEQPRAPPDSLPRPHKLPNKANQTNKPSHAQLITSGGLQEFDDHLLLQPHHLSSIELSRILWGCNSVPSYLRLYEVAFRFGAFASRRLKGFELCTASSGRTLKKPFWTDCEGGTPGNYTLKDLGRFRTMAEDNFG